MIGCEEFWNRRSRVFDDQVGPRYEEAYRRTAAGAIKYLKPTDRVLEFACGTGITTVEIAPHVDSVLGIDISMDMVRKAQNKVAMLGLPNVHITKASLFSPDLEEKSFDAVTAFNVLQYVKDVDKVLARIRSLLKPGGYFFSATDCLGNGVTREGMKKLIKSHTGQMPHVTFFRQENLPGIIVKAGFEIQEYQNLFPAPPNLFVAARRV